MKLPFKETKVVQLTFNLLHERAIFNFPELRWLMDMFVYMPANITRSLGLNSSCRDAQLHTRKETLSETDKYYQKMITFVKYYAKATWYNIYLDLYIHVYDISLTLFLPWYKFMRHVGVPKSSLNLSKSPENLVSIIPDFP